MKRDTIINNLERTGYKKVGNSTWQNDSGLSVIMSENTLRVQVNGKFFTNWKLSDITVKNGYVCARKPKSRCVKLNKGCKDNCDACLSYDFGGKK